MSLQEKVINLKLNAVLAVKHAQGWQRLIDLYGEDKATEFYKHLGLNHLEKKSVQWEGMTLSREPKEHEKIAVKGIATAQESSKEAIGNILLALRTELITDGLEGIKKLEPATYHELVLDTPREFRNNLRERLVQVHRQGRLLVAAELGKKVKQAWGIEYKEISPEEAAIIDKWWEGSRGPHAVIKEAVPEDEFDDLDMLTDLTDSRIVNDVQSRIIAAAQRYRLLGLTGPEFINAVHGEITAGSVSYIDRAATGLANRVISIGRSDEAERRRADWGRAEYSALLDQNVCGPCASEDGQEAENEADLTPTPNPECEGGDWCRCFHVFVQD